MVFSHLALNCSDPIATERFYARHFGFERARVIPIGDDQQIVFTKLDDVYLEIFQAEGEDPGGEPEGDGPIYPGIRHLAFQVDDVDAQIRAMGGEAVINLGPLDFDAFIPGWRTVWLMDPDGRIVEVSQGYVDERDPPPLEEGISLER
jgi:glyoxylase I family protein